MTAAASATSAARSAPAPPRLSVGPKARCSRRPGSRKPRPETTKTAVTSPVHMHHAFTLGHEVSERAPAVARPSPPPIPRYRAERAAARCLPVRNSAAARLPPRRAWLSSLPVTVRKAGVHLAQTRAAPDTATAAQLVRQVSARVAPAQHETSSPPEDHDSRSRAGPLPRATFRAYAPLIGATGHHRPVPAWPRVGVLGYRLDGKN
jgi:hypothetical protein